MVKGWKLGVVFYRPKFMFDEILNDIKTKIFYTYDGMFAV